MKRILVGVALAALGLSTFAIAGSAAASVTVLGGGLADACAKAAFAGKSEQQFERMCTQALETEMLDSRDRAGTYVNRGILKLRRLDWIEAMKDFDEAVRLRPDLGEAYVNRGAASVGEHRYSAGLSDLNKGLALGVEEPEKAYYNRALAYEGLDDVKSAYFDYQKALELNPQWNAPKEQLTRFKVSHKE